MSLLEDVFLEDEAGEAQELERVIEGDEYDERLRSDSDNNSEKEDEAEEDKRRVDPSKGKVKRVTKNPRFILNPARLTGPRGIQVIPDHFKDFKFKGKKHEKEDLEIVLKKLEHWAYRLYPKFQFEDCLKKIEMLGKKRPVMVHLQKIRSDQFLSEEIVDQKESSDEETAPQEEDEFDKLLQQQIELARATPAPDSVKKPAFSTSMVENRSLAMPKATSSPSISDEQRERMLKNRRLAEERRMSKLKALQSNSSIESNEPIMEIDDQHVDGQSQSVTVNRHNKSNVIDSDSEEESNVVNQSVSVDIHNKNNRIDSEDEEITDGIRKNIENNVENQFVTIDITEADKNGDEDKEYDENVIESTTAACDRSKIIEDDIFKEILNNDANFINQNHKDCETGKDFENNYETNVENENIADNVPDKNNSIRSEGNMSKEYFESKQDIENQAIAYTPENNKIGNDNEITKNNTQDNNVNEKHIAVSNIDQDHSLQTDECSFDKKTEKINTSSKLEENTINEKETQFNSDKENVNNDESVMENKLEENDLMDIDFSDDF